MVCITKCEKKIWPSFGGAWPPVAPPGSATGSCFKSWCYLWLKSLVSWSHLIILKNCFAHIRDLRRIHNTLNHNTTCTSPTSLIYSKLDYYNSLFLNLRCQQTNRLKLNLNSAARVVTKTPEYNLLTPHLKSILWLKITQYWKYVFVFLWKSYDIKIIILSRIILRYWVIILAAILAAFLFCERLHV